MNPRSLNLRHPLSKPAVGFFAFAFFLLFGAPLIAPEMGVQDWLLWFCAAGSLLVMVAPPVFIKDYDLFQPLTFLTISVAIGVPARVLFLLSTTDMASRNDLMRGQPVSYLLGGTLTIFLGLLMLVAGYFYKPFGKPIRPLAKVYSRISRPWSGTKMVLLLILLALLSVIGFYLFVKALGLNAAAILGNFSSKRFVRLPDGSISPLGGLRLMMRGVAIAFLVCFTWFSFSGKRWFSGPGIASGFLLILAEIPPIFTSSRSDVILYPVIALSIWNYSRRRITFGKLAAFGLVAVMAIAILGSLRANKDQDVGTAALTSLGGGVVDSVVNNSNFLSAPTTAHMMAAVPQKAPFEYGKTMILWMAAPVPRALWPGKPEVVSGQEVARIVLDRVSGMGKGGGIPPNIVTDLYWNFGVLGVPVGMFLFGYLLRRLYQTSLPFIAGSPSALLLYFLTIFPFAHYVFVGSFSQGMIRTLTNSVLGYIVISLVSVSHATMVRRRRAEVARQSAAGQTA